MGYMAD